MKLERFNVTSRNILFKEVIQEKTEGGIYIPHKGMLLTTGPSMFDQTQIQYDGSKEKIGDYIVVKVGKDVDEVRPGDILVLTDGIQPRPIVLDDETYLQVFEMQVVGYERPPVSLSIEDFKTGKEELAGEITEDVIAAAYSSKKILT